MNSVLTAQQIYEIEPESVNKNPCSFITGYTFSPFPELQDSDYYNFNTENAERLEIKIVKYFNFDGRRIWQLSTIWLDSQPVMIIQNAGREGGDHGVTFITNEKLYRELVDYLRSLVAIEDIYEVEVIPLDIPMIELTNFYDYNLFDEFKMY